MVPSTGPNSAASGQNGSPKGQPPKFQRGGLSGRNVYGSRQGAAPRES